MKITFNLDIKKERIQDFILAARTNNDKKILEALKNILLDDFEIEFSAKNKQEIEINKEK